MGMRMSGSSTLPGLWSREVRMETHTGAQWEEKETQRQAGGGSRKPRQAAWGAAFLGPLWQGPSSPLEAPPNALLRLHRPQSDPSPH